MKAVLTLVFYLSLTIISHAQVVVGLPEFVVFFRGYYNKVEAASQNGVKHISLVSPDIQFAPVEDNDQQYIGTVITEATSSKVYMLNARNGDTIDVFDIKIQGLPDPVAFFGGAEDGGTASKQETRFFVKYGPEIPLNVNFTILQGYITLPEGRVIEFSGNQLKKEESDVLQAIEGRAQIHVTLIVKGPDKLQRTVTATFNI